MRIKYGKANEKAKGKCLLAYFHNAIRLPFYKVSLLVSAIVVAVIFSGCSTEKNTARNRWWHSFNTRYNVYYNGAEAYIDGSLEKETGNKDNYTEMLPLYTVGNKTSVDLGKSNYDRAIEKSQKAIKLHSIKLRPEWTKNRKKTERDIEWLNRKEYNPFMWKVWMLMGRSQFMKGSFDEAASTFAYMSRLYSTQPAIYGRARAWLAKCYIEQDWIYDAEDVITKIRRDSIHWRAVKEWDYTYADYYIHLKQYEKAIPYLRKVIKHEMRRKQKAREWYIMGQMEAALGHNELAYKAFKHVIRLHPPYELEFNARIAMTEVMAGQQSKKMIRKLKRMASSSKNKEYLDQVYYAIGNIYLAQKDTTNAIGAYEKGNAKSTRNGIEKGVLLLTLGDLYWAKEDYSNARRCYGEAIGLLDKERDDYEQLSERSKVLDELVPYTEAVHLQDSLQALTKMSEEERNAAIDRVIEELKKREKAQKDSLAEAEAQRQLAEQNGQGNVNKKQTTTNTNTEKTSVWYFYNPTAVMQGKSTFQKTWGKRENVDDWQRVNKTVVAFNTPEEEMTEEQLDSIARVEAAEDSIKDSMKDDKNNPHKREYYLAQLPFSDEQIAESNNIIKDGLYNAGVIFKDKLNHLVLGEKFLRRLVDNYSDYEGLDNAYYHLFLLYSRLQNKTQADYYLSKLKQDFPQSQWTTLLSDPYYEENARYGVHIEDSLYAATYDAFKAGRYAEVSKNAELSAKRFPLGDNRDKFIFINGLSKLNNGDSNGCIADMEEVVSKYPKSGVSTMAGMIINGVKAGRQLRGGRFDIGDVWSHRSVVLNDKDSTKIKTFTAERNTDFSFIIAYQPDSVNENQMLFELARFNFTNFIVRNFDIEIDELNGLHRMKISGFRSYDEALQYARQLYGNERIKLLTEKARAIIISNTNLELLGTQYSYTDYDKFYEEHFVPLRISTVRLLTEPATIEYNRQTESQQESEDGLYNGGVIETGESADDGGLTIDMNVDDNAEGQDNGSTQVNEGITIPVETPATEQETDTYTIPQETETAPVAPAETPVAPVEAEPTTTVVAPVAPAETPTTPVESTVAESETIIPVQTEEPVDDSGTIISIPENAPVDNNQNTTDVQEDNSGITITVPESEVNAVSPGSTDVYMPVEEPSSTTVSPDVPSGTVIIPTETTETKENNKGNNTQQPASTQQTEDTGIDFNDGFGSTDNNNGNKTEDTRVDSFDLEDEYYDLNGF
ncbi:MAG: hypothetical protein Q4D41_09905 [Prevotellaceae bacterium]|nr:hypothetical protein [Prevotellaceae bacterium]